MQEFLRSPNHMPFPSGETGKTYVKNVRTVLGWVVLVGGGAVHPEEGCTISGSATVHSGWFYRNEK